MKTIVKMAALSAALLALAGTASVAFEEQKAPGGAAPAAGVAGSQAPAPAAVPKSEGTEIRIPGLGKLGTLPKMDFGLELLYGAAETERQQEPSNMDDPQDLTIKGSIKHKF